MHIKTRVTSFQFYFYNFFLRCVSSIFQLLPPFNAKFQSNHCALHRDALICIYLHIHMYVHMCVFICSFRNHVKSCLTNANSNDGIIYLCSIENCHYEYLYMQVSTDIHIYFTYIYPNISIRLQRKKYTKIVAIEALISGILNLKNIFVCTHLRLVSAVSVILI